MCESQRFLSVAVKNIIQIFLQTDVKTQLKTFGNVVSSASKIIQSENWMLRKKETRLMTENRDDILALLVNKDSSQSFSKFDCKTKL